VAQSKDHDRILGLRGELAGMRDQIHAAETKYARLLDDFRTAMTFTDNERDEVGLYMLHSVYP
jgi:hypothetical protein